MKKGWKIFLYVLLGIGCYVTFTVVLATLMVIPYVNFNSNSTTLSKSAVKKKFNNEWKEKTYIDANDLREYKYLENNCFDDIPHQLEYVELPENIKFWKFYIAIKWEKVSMIKVEKETSELFVLNDLLFCSRRVLTIVDREKRIETLNFPLESEFANKIKVFYDEKKRKPKNYGIAENFYNEKVFRNVGLINMEYTNENDPVAISDIYESAFENCNKLSKKIDFRYMKDPRHRLVIHDRAFYNTNIEEAFFMQMWTYFSICKNAFAKNENLNKLNVIGNHVIAIGEYSFCDNKNLSEINFIVDSLWLQKNSFSSSIPVNQRRVVIETLFDRLQALIIDNNAFSGKYNNFKLWIKEPTRELLLDKRSLFGIDCMIENFSLIFKLNYEAKLDRTAFLNKGLKQEQYDKIEIKKI